MVLASVAHLGTLDELDAVLNILADIHDSDLRCEAVIGGDESDVVLFHAFPHVAWHFISRSLEKSSEAMEIQKNCDILRILWQVDGEFDVEITDCLVDDLLAHHLGAFELDGGVVVFENGDISVDCGMDECGKSKRCGNSRLVGVEGRQAR
jgi:hypothetical protein